MDKLDKLYGIITCDNLAFSFVFDTKDFFLKMFPPAEAWFSEKFNALDIYQRNYKRNKWSTPNYLYGSTSEGYAVVFCVGPFPSVYNGIRTYDVNWVFYHSDGDNSHGIKGLRLYGGDINLFYPSERAISANIQFDSNHIKGIQISSNPLEGKPCGKYRFIPHVDAVITVNAFSSYYEKNTVHPISANSSLTLEYSHSVSIKDAVKSVFELTQFLRYACYRNNISYDAIEAFTLSNENTREFNGCVLIPNLAKTESDERNRHRIIPYDFWQKNVGKMLTSIKNGELGFQHLCESLDDIMHYSSGRLLFIYAEFEREYRNIYGIDHGRSEEYKEYKKDVIKLLGKYAEKKNSKIRRYIKQEVGHIKNSGTSYSSLVRNAMLDCEEIMAPFIASKYTDKYKKVANDLGDRVQTMRNNLAHSNTNINYRPVLLTDVKIIEELTYAIRLKEYNSCFEVQKAIKSLFGETQVKLKE